MTFTSKIFERFLAFGEQNFLEDSFSRNESFKEQNFLQYVLPRNESSTGRKVPRSFIERNSAVMVSVFKNSGTCNSVRFQLGK